MRLELSKKKKKNQFYNNSTKIARLEKEGRKFIKQNN